MWPETRPFAMSELCQRQPAIVGGLREGRFSSWRSTLHITIPEQDNGHDIATPTPSRCLYAASEHSYRRLALSGCMAGHEFQLRAPETLHPGAGAGEVRCLLHGRPYGRA